MESVSLVSLLYWHGACCPLFIWLLVVTALCFAVTISSVAGVLCPAGGLHGVCHVSPCLVLATLTGVAV